MGQVIVGTSGFSYADWIGPFYPAGMKQKDFLGFYAEKLSMTELNFTYYRMPGADSLRRMGKIAGEHFRFSVKAHRSLTHEIDRESLQSGTEQFIRGVEPLMESGQLSAILLQFPFSFRYSPHNRRYLDSLCSGFDGFPLVIEFRRDEWMQEKVYSGLRERRIAVANVDAPALPGLPAKSAVVTSDTGYVRFHGRNEKNWWSGDNVTRYDYLYSQSELEDWVPQIVRMAQRAGVVFAVFNNHARGQAVENARALNVLIKSRLG
ncbi:hypothetical protein CHISP_0590 [Chitinispirillum alkaliphilum]|nr:hypothetical protein CHISP_0590 [Chitinispirillum alkaliphilum]